MSVDSARQSLHPILYNRVGELVDEGHCCDVSRHPRGPNLPTGVGALSFLKRGECSPDLAADPSLGSRVTGRRTITSKPTTAPSSHLLPLPGDDVRPRRPAPTRGRPDNMIQVRRNPVHATQLRRRHQHTGAG